MSDGGVTIRGYRAGDLTACRELWVELTQHHRDIYDSPTIGGAEPGLQFDEHLSKVGPDNLWVADLDGTVIGLTGVIPDRTTAELEPLVVRAQQRGRGVGRALASAAIEATRARGSKQLKVRPVARNADAIRAFHALGFTVLGHVECFMDFGAPEAQSWKSGERLADRDFKL